MEIGIDIEQIDRFKKMKLSHLQRIFTKNEIDYAQKFLYPEEHFCAFWCVKEAFYKACSYKNINFQEIEIDHKENGQPFIIKTPKIENILNDKNLKEIKVSISHSGNFSTAVCLLY